MLFAPEVCVLIVEAAPLFVTTTSQTLSKALFRIAGLAPLPAIAELPSPAPVMSR